MTCRHQPGDPNCSSHPSRVYERARADAAQEATDRENARQKVLASLPTTPDAEKFEIIDMERISSNVVLKVRYPNCSKCAYEGVKVLVYLNVTEKQIIRWKKIDPHFDDPAKLGRLPSEAPPPAARFPASKEGWADATAYAMGKVKT